MKKTLATIIIVAVVSSLIASVFAVSTIQTTSNTVTIKVNSSTKTYNLVVAINGSTTNSYSATEGDSLIVTITVSPADNANLLATLIIDGVAYRSVFADGITGIAVFDPITAQIGTHTFTANLVSLS